VSHDSLEPLTYNQVKRGHRQLPKYQTVDGATYDLDDFDNFPGFPKWLRGQFRPSTTLVYVALFYFEWLDAEPKLETLAAMVGVSRSTVQRAIKELEAGGYIRVHPEYTQYGMRLPNRVDATC
jgi:hypothetical protein